MIQISKFVLQGIITNILACHIQNQNTNRIRAHLQIRLIGFYRRFKWLTKKPLRLEIYYSN